MEQNSNLEGPSCQEIFALLSQYLDAELPPDLREKLSGHIERCTPCVEFVNSLRQSIALCRDLQLEQMPGELAEEVRNKMRRAYEATES